MKSVIPFASILCISTLSGCASITTDAMQPVDVKTKSKQGQSITQAKCTLSNEKGNWSVVTPNTVSVHKASGELAVNCKKANQPDGNAKAISRAGAGMYGNILIGGGIGAVIDHNSGKAYNYPDKIDVIMGETVTIDRRDSSTHKKK